MRERLRPYPFLRLEELFSRRLSTLSGGEHQRVRLGQAFLSGAPWLLLDEPANHLDLATAWSVYDYLSRERIEGGVIVALHDLATAVRLCQEILVLNGGRLVAQGSPREVLTKSLLEDVFGLRAEIVESSGSFHLDIRGTAPVASAKVTSR